MADKLTYDKVASAFANLLSPNDKQTLTTFYEAIFEGSKLSSSSSSHSSSSSYSSTSTSSSSHSSSSTSTSKDDDTIRIIYMLKSGLSIDALRPYERQLLKDTFGNEWQSIINK
jgi:hypothetical protein